MNNILIIKHGSLGDVIQALGAIEDIKNRFKDSKVYLLTSAHYIDFMSHCPYLDGVISDKRLPRWNIFYLSDLKNKLTRFNFVKVFDLQNSKRTKFYEKFILNKCKWSSSETTLKEGQTKEDFDKYPVLSRMKLQLEKSDVHTEKILNADISWAIQNINRIIKQHTNNEYILIFPFCSKKHKKKKWPYFNELNIKLKKILNKYDILIVPGPGEISEAKNFNAKIVIDKDNKPVNIFILVSLISKAKFIISNDTGPAHIASILNKNGLVLFGDHISPEKVNLGNNNFKSLKVKNLVDLKVDTVIEEMRKKLN